jgi:FMN phosphatase YigB (HAD superfamily)
MAESQNAFQTQKPKFIILDIDQVLFKYWPGYVDQFYIQTMHTAWEMMTDEQRASFDSIEQAEQEIIELSKLSYQRTDSATDLVAQRFGLDNMELYRRSHRELVDHVRINRHLVDHDPHVSIALAKLKQQGYKIYALTNGSEDYGRGLLNVLGIDRYIDDAAGADSFHPKQLRFKKYSSTWVDVFEKFEIPSTSGYLSRSGEMRTCDDSDYGHVLVADDRDDNIVGATKYFNVHGLWVDTGQNAIDPKNVMHIRSRTNSIGRYLADMSKDGIDSDLQKLIFEIRLSASTVFRRTP